MSLHSEDLASPCSDLADKRVAGGGCKDLVSHDEDIFTLDVDGEAPEEEMECELEEETVQDPGGVRTISNPGQASKKEREEHEATHAKHRSWCISCGRGRGIAMTHHRSTGAGGDEGKLHTFVMDYCFSSQGGRQGITMLVIKETKTKAISTFMVPNEGANEYYVKAVVDFMSTCGCGHAIHKGDSEFAVVALQDAVNNSRYSDTILENAPKGDSHKNGVAANTVREAEGMIRTWKNVCRGKLKAVIDNKHVLLPWLVMHAGVSITRYKTVHDGKTACREDQEQETKQQDATVWRKCRLDDAESQSHNEQAGFDSSIWSVRLYRAKNRRVCGSYS